MSATLTLQTGASQVLLNELEVTVLVAVVFLQTLHGIALRAHDYHWHTEIVRQYAFGQGLQRLQTMSLDCNSAMYLAPPTHHISAHGTFFLAFTLFRVLLKL